MKHLSQASDIALSRLPQLDVVPPLLLLGEAKARLGR